MRERMNIMVDRELLEQARKVTGEEAYSDAIEKALRDVVRQHDARKAREEFSELARRGELFDDDYIRENFPDVAALMPPMKQKRSASERRLPKQGRRRASR